jgi:hypothetical protein
MSMNMGLNYTNSSANEKPDGQSFFSPTNAVTIIGNFHDIWTRDANGNIKAVGERGRINPVSVIEDIKHRIEARCGTHLILYSTLVQGEKAAAEIIQGIKFFNRLAVEKKPQVLIIARGGGSFEDLMPFNDEALVREVFKSEIKCTPPILGQLAHILW